MTEIVAYGVLATAVAAAVLYLDGQSPGKIAVVAGAILGLLVTLVLIAPRLRVPARTSVRPPGHARTGATSGDVSSARPVSDALEGDAAIARAVSDAAEGAVTHARDLTADSNLPIGDATPARAFSPGTTAADSAPQPQRHPSTPGRRAKRGRRRR